MGKVKNVLTYSFWVYNKWGELLRRHGRKEKMETEHPVIPVDPIEFYLMGKNFPVK